MKPWLVSLCTSTNDGQRVICSTQRGSTWPCVIVERESKTNVVWHTRSNNTFPVVAEKNVAPDLLAATLFDQVFHQPRASLCYCSDMAGLCLSLHDLGRGATQFAKAKNAVANGLSSIFLRGIFHPVHVGNPKAGELLLYCNFASSPSSGGAEPYVFATDSHCEIELVTKDKNLICKSSEEILIWKSEMPAATSQRLSFYASAVCFKKGQSLLSSNVKHTSPIPARRSDLSCILLNSALLWENAPVSTERGANGGGIHNRILL